MSVIPKLLAKRVSETTITIIDSSRLSYYPITEWDIRVIIVLWVLFFITLVFVVLRLYSRVRVLQFYALEDYLYNIAFTILLAYNAIITFYSYHGLGSQLLSVMTTSDVHLAVVFENVLFDLASIGLLMAKSSLISFLMRLVPQHQSVFRWRVLVMGPLLALAVVSFGAMMAMWARCFGVLNGTSALCTDITQAMHWMQVAAGVSVAVDLWYAAMPWYLLHRLTRPRKEKWLVQGSMSLGVIAAGCGIGRAFSIYPAANNTDAKSAAILYLWHGAEMAVTMICIGVPVCRPAVNSMLQAVGIRFLALHPSSSKDRRNNTNSNTKGNYPQTTSSYIRNFGQNATWEEAVGAIDVDSWSQRRILGVGDTTSGATSGGSINIGDNIHGGGSRGESGGECVGIFGADAKEFGLGYPMRSLSKSGITVTKTVDVTNGSKDSPRL